MRNADLWPARSAAGHRAEPRPDRSPSVAGIIPNSVRRTDDTLRDKTLRFRRLGHGHSRGEIARRAGWRSVTLSHLRIPALFGLLGTGSRRVSFNRINIDFRSSSSDTFSSRWGPATTRSPAPGPRARAPAASSATRTRRVPSPCAVGPSINNSTNPVATIRVILLIKAMGTMLTRRTIRFQVGRGTRMIVAVIVAVKVMSILKPLQASGHVEPLTSHHMLL